LIEGDFIKKENRSEFTECYNNLIKLEDYISRFDRNISPGGDIGKRYLQAKNDMSSLPVKRRKLQKVVEEAANITEHIISQTKEAVTGMTKILNGILKKSADDKYDTLSNLNVIAGRGTAFLDGIRESIIHLNKTSQLMDDIDAMEAGR
jgi:actin-like ATPase involved in cell morphogenesis